MKRSPILALVLALLLLVAWLANVALGVALTIVYVAAGSLLVG